MANSPRKPNSRRSSDQSSVEEDLFAAETPAPADAADGAADPIEDEWHLEEAPDSGPRSRQTALPAQPIPPPGGASFESNLNSAVTASVEQAAPAPPAPAPTPASSAKPSAYDPFEIDDDLPTVSAGAPSPAPSQEQAPGATPPAGQPLESAPDPLDKATDPAEDSEPQPLPKKRDPLSLAAAAVILLGLLGAFAGILYANRPASDAGPSRATPDLPMAGQLVTLSDVQSAWRRRQPGDLASTVDVALPAVSRVQPEFLPQVSFTVDAGATRTGFLRFIFLDGDRKIAGDVRLVKITGGTIDPLQSGATSTTPGTSLVYGSSGFMDRPGFVGYASGDAPRWSVEVSESAEANAKEENWHRLGTFDIRNSTNL